MTAALSSVGFVYKWTNLLNGKWYIGSHGGDPSDKYIGSGIAFKKALKKYSLSNFRRDILYVGSDYKATETWHLSTLDAANNPMSYNLTNKAIYREKLGVHSSEHRQKISLALLGNKNGMANKGRKISSEQRERIRITLTGRQSSRKGKPSGRLPWNKGKTMSSEVKRKISAARRKAAKANPRFGANAPTYGKSPWNKGKRGMQIAWNKGLKNYSVVSNETKRKLSESTKKVWLERKLRKNGGIVI